MQGEVARVGVVESESTIGEATSCVFVARLQVTHSHEWMSSPLVKLGARVIVLVVRLPPERVVFLPLTGVSGGDSLLEMEMCSDIMATGILPAFRHGCYFRLDTYVWRLSPLGRLQQTKRFHQNQLRPVGR